MSAADQRDSPGFSRGEGGKAIDPSRVGRCGLRNAEPEPSVSKYFVEVHTHSKCLGTHSLK